MLWGSLAYGKQAGDNIDMNKINKTFEVSLKPSQRKMINMLKDIPLEYMEISDCVIKEAKVDLEVDDYSLYQFNRSYSYKHRAV